MTKSARLQRPLTLALALTAALALAACGQTASPVVAPITTASPTTALPGGHGDAPGGHSTAGAHTMSPAIPSQSAGRMIEISVKGKQVTPSPATVNIAVGESLTIAVTSDKNNTLHAHGFDIAKDLKAGRREEVTIKGAQTGTFEFELHDPELRLFTVAVR